MARPDRLAAGLLARLRSMEPLFLAVEALRRRRGIKWHRYPEDVLPAWVADMDCGVAEPVQRAIARVVEAEDYAYPQREGDDRLEVAFAERMLDRFGWEVDPGRVLPVADLVQASTAAILAYSAPGDGVVVQTPIYPPFLACIADTGRTRVANPLVEGAGGRPAVDLDGLRAALDERARVLLLCNPHNPTGRALDRDELLGLGRLAVERDLVIVSDEIHCDLVYPGHRHLPIASLGPEIAARAVTINSATKGFNIAGLRCGVMHFGSDALWERFCAAVPTRLLGAVSVVGLDATAAAWREGQPWLEAVLARLAANRERVARWAAEEVDGIRHHPPEATYLAWLDCRDLDLPGPTPQEFFLEQARVALGQGADFGPRGDTCVRLNFATSPEILEEMLARMTAALGRARAGAGRA
jgi:cysteine-S-conjugate beta-lyase